jgi:ketosteroid isomerase-like protein
MSPTAAIVRGRFVLTMKPAREPATGRFTLVFRKFENGWKITSDHTSAAERR